MKKIIVLIISVFMVGCVTTKPLTHDEYIANRQMQLKNKLPPPPRQDEIDNADYGKLPSDYQEMIKRYLSVTLKDPYSAMYNFYNEPVKGYIQDLELHQGRATFGWLVKFSYNAKNSYGAYVGNTYESFFVFKDNQEGRYYANPTSASQFDYIFVKAN